MATRATSDAVPEPSSSPFDILMASKHAATMTGGKIKSNENVITGTPNRSSSPRTLYIGCSPMDINKKIFGTYADISAKVYKIITRADEAPPNILFHWAVIVGDYVHELDYDPHYYNYYVNKKFNADAKPGDSGYYRVYRVGTTQYNDAAIVEEGVKAIAEPFMLPRYDVRKNNCQRFVMELIKLICDPHRKKLTTTYGWSEQEVTVHPPMRQAVAYEVPEGATPEELKALAEQAQNKSDENYKVAVEQAAEKKRLAEQAAAAQGMEEILQQISELIATGEEEGKAPDPPEDSVVVVVDNAE